MTGKIHPSMLAPKWDPLGQVEKARSLDGDALREWLETEAQWRVRDADEDIRPFVKLLQIMREDDRYRQAGLSSWNDLCAILMIKPEPGGSIRGRCRASRLATSSLPWSCVPSRRRCHHGHSLQPRDRRGAGAAGGQA